MADTFVKHWYVINVDNQTSVDDEGDGASFLGEADAAERAAFLSRENPGEYYEVVSTARAFIAPVASVEEATVVE